MWIESGTNYLLPIEPDRRFWVFWTYIKPSENHIKHLFAFYGFTVLAYTISFILHACRISLP